VLDITIGTDGTVALTGRFDASQADAAKEKLGGIQGPLVVDLSGLEYISSAGISVLLVTYKRLADAGQSMKLVNMSDRVRNVFHFAGLDRVFEIE
jgi:anti-sigma B factor antagonist